MCFVTNCQIGYSTVNAYYCAVLDLFKEQQCMAANNTTKDALRSKRVITLLNLCKGRRKRAARQNFDEKIDHIMAPYILVDKVTSLANFFFQKNSNSTSLCQSSLRDRFSLLMTVHGILRGESLFLCELSDLILFCKHDEGKCK
jgi:hypothetical protein